MTDTGVDLTKLLQRALASHQAGDLRAAEVRYKMLIAAQADHFDALHLLGVLAGQQERHDLAQRRIGEAIAVNARSEAALANRGAALATLSRFDDALASYAAALEIVPDHAASLYGRGNIFLATGRNDDALASYQAALSVDPDFVEALSNRGIALSRLGRHSDASTSHGAALAIRSDLPQPWNNRGRALLALGRSDDALACFETAMARDPEHVEACNNRGSAFLALGRGSDALASYEAALVLAPTHVEAWTNRANAQVELRRPDQALSSTARALAVAPKDPDALNNRGVALAKLGRFSQALDCYDAAVAIRPAHPETLTNRGSVLTRLKRRGEAVTGYEMALMICPNHVDALYNRGNVLAQLLRHEEAVASYDRALAVDPGFHLAQSNKIFSLDFIFGLDFEDHGRARRRWFEAHARRYASLPEPHSNGREPSRRLVLGYVSADFKRHSAAYTFGPILRRHDKANFELVLYSGVEDEDEMTEDFRRLADRWRPSAGWSDDEFAGQIRSDGIDILVDLSGHTEGNRLMAFARKPAPIQVTAWGHATGTGNLAIDYLFSDAVTIPRSARAQFAEEVVDLPCAITFEVPGDWPQVGESPARANGFVTLGCLNRFSKISRHVLGLWARILRSLPRSRLLLKDRALDDAALRTFALDAFAAVDISADRVDLRGGSSRRDHLEAYNEVDIALDPFPQNGGLSTWEALWMGCPAIAKLGNTVSGRASAAILSSVDLGDWVATSDDDYVALAIGKAEATEALGHLRSRLRSIIAASPAGNPDLYVRAVETAYRDMWKRWCTADRSGL